VHKYGGEAESSINIFLLQKYNWWLAIETSKLGETNETHQNTPIIPQQTFGILMLL
jgi:hypothetical protein